MKGRPLVMRADANAKIGLGHVARCLALAEPWTKCGMKVFLLAAQPSAATRARAEKIGVTVLELRSESRSAAVARETTETVIKMGAWLVLDRPLGTNIQREFKQEGVKVLLFDDNGEQEHYYADIVLNQNWGATEEMYVNRESYTRLWLGPKFAQLRGDVLKARKEREIREGANKVLVTMGGSDPDNVTARALEGLTGMEVTVVVGPENRHWESEGDFYRRKQREQRVEVVKSPENFAELMAGADVAITAAGSTAWELAYLGTPMVATVIAENQRSNARHLDAEGLARSAEIDAAGSEARWLAEDVVARREMSRRQRSMFDGLGSQRVWLRLNENLLTLRAVDLEGEDAKGLWILANDPEVRAVSFSPGEIPWGDHIQWLKHKMNDANCRLWIAGIPESIGQIRFDISGSDAMLSISLLQQWRGKSLGTLLVWAGSRKLFMETAVEKVHAFVKPENLASARAFEKAGFERLAEARVKEQRALHFVLSRTEAEL